MKVEPLSSHLRKILQKTHQYMALQIFAIAIMNRCAARGTTSSGALSPQKLRQSQRYHALLLTKNLGSICWTREGAASPHIAVQPEAQPHLVHFLPKIEAIPMLSCTSSHQKFRKYSPNNRRGSFSSHCRLKVLCSPRHNLISHRQQQSNNFSYPHF